MQLECVRPDIAKRLLLNRFGHHRPVWWHGLISVLMTMVFGNAQVAEIQHLLLLYFLLLFL